MLSKFGLILIILNLEFIDFHGCELTRCLINIG